MCVCIELIFFLSDFLFYSLHYRLKVVWNHMSLSNYSMVAVLSLQPITHPTFHLDLQEHHLLKSCRLLIYLFRIHMCIHIQTHGNISHMYKMHGLPSLPSSLPVFLPLIRVTASTFLVVYLTISA